jgi:DNA helicase-4
MITKTSFIIGSQVRHYKHGNGVIKRMLGNGLLEVKFSHGSEYVNSSNVTAFTSPTSNPRPKRKSATPRALTAKEIEQINAEKLRKQKAKEEQATRQAKLREQKLKKQRSLNELREIFKNSYIGADDFYENSCKQFVTEDEFHKEKVQFVQNWLDINTPSAPKGKVKHKLDNDQALAVSTVNGNVHVTARAGSGKTTTLVYRTYFLIKHCNIKAEEILLLAFNRKAAQEIRKRIFFYSILKLN